MPLSDKKVELESIEESSIENRVIPSQPPLDDLNVETRGRSSWCDVS